MNNIEIKWEQQEANIIKLTSEGIDSFIEVNKEAKDIKNIKTFFREILFKAYVNDWDKQIVLASNDIEINEVTVLLNELIDLCNEEMKLIKA